MIDWFFGPRTSDGVKHDTLEAAQAHEIMLLLAPTYTGPDDRITPLSHSIVEHGDAIVAILQTKPSQAPKRKPRKDKGKPRAKSGTIETGN